MKIAAGKFKAKCLSIMDDIQKNHEEVTVTKYGKPVAKLVPVEGDERTPPVFGFLKGSVSIHGDIIGPVGEKWDVEN
ncbi:type II toxin-antitoxin system prevent-host-death family antitoxin [Bdellovibrionota bacterium FG-2]